MADAPPKDNTNYILGLLGKYAPNRGQPGQLEALANGLHQWTPLRASLAGQQGGPNMNALYPYNGFAPDPYGIQPIGGGAAPSNLTIPRGAGNNTFGNGFAVGSSSGGSGGGMSANPTLSATQISSDPIPSLGSAPGGLAPSTNPFQAGLAPSAAPTNPMDDPLFRSNPQYTGDSRAPFGISPNGKLWTAMDMNMGGSGGG